MTKQEKEWDILRSKYIVKLEERVNELELENFDLREKLEEEERCRQFNKLCRGNNVYEIK